MRRSPLGLLLVHETRLLWRGSIFGGRHGVTILLAVAMVLHLAGYAVARDLARHRFAPAERVLDATLLILFVGGIMLSQAVQRASELLDDRTDLGWLLSTPAPPWTILIVRLLAVAGAVLLYWAVLLLPIADCLAWSGAPGILGAYAILPVLSLLATACGFFATFGLLRVTSVRRTRSLANTLATFIGAGVFLSGQARSLLPQARADAFWHAISPSAADADAGWVWLPGRALLGAPGPLLALVLAAGAATAVTGWGLRRWFASGTQAVVAGSMGAGRVLRHDARAFRAGSFAALFAKESLLLRRYPGLAGLAIYYLVYLVPAVAALWQGAAHGDARVFGAAPVLSAGELARLFISVTVMGDEAGELVGTAPVPPRAVSMAKLAAAAAGVTLIMGLPVLGLAITLPAAVPAMLAGMAGNIGCNLLLGLWRPAPIRRTDLRRNRRGWGGLVNLVGFAFSAAWSLSAWLMLQGSAWAAAPACAAVLILIFCRPRTRRKAAIGAAT